MTNHEVSIAFFLLLALVLATCRIMGLIGKYFGQPQVVCEMIAGVLLGPSLFGLLLPEMHASLFPKQVMPVVYCVAQVGLVLYMFLIGVEFRGDLLKARARSALSVSLAGILVPFSLGLFAAAMYHKEHGLFSPDVSISQAALYMGAAMSITAFPMLARIIYERRMSGTRLGTLALAAGSVDDALAWCLLAVVLAMFKGDSLIAWKAMGGGVAYVLFVLFIIRPILAKAFGSPNARRGLGLRAFAMVLTLVSLGAWFTDFIGIYAVFGAFIMGLAMPRGRFALRLEERIEPLTTNFLLPLFFVYSGLNTRIGLVNTVDLWIMAGIILLFACAGKGVACSLAARMNGEPWRESLAIGALMNARGLMELIILNIGLEHGVITPTLFSIMVIMAIVTTLMATPLFEWIYGRQRDAEIAAARPAAA